MFNTTMSGVLEDYYVICRNDRKEVNNYAKAIVELVEVIAKETPLPLRENFIFNYNEKGVKTIENNKGEIIYEQ